MSSFELNRRAKIDPKYKQQLIFNDIFPGLRVLIIVCDLILVLAITSLAYANWQSAGTLIAFGVIILAYLMSRSLRRLTADLIKGNLAWFNKYFSWAELLGRISLKPDEERIHSRQELSHIIEKADFMSEADKDLIAGTLKASEVKAKDIMVPRKEIIVVQLDESVSPKMIDELHSTGKRVFPVIDGSWDKVVGALYLDDVMVLSRADSKLTDIVRPSLPTLTESLNIIEVLEEMAKQHATTVLLKNSKNQITGMLSLSQLLEKIENK